MLKKKFDFNALKIKSGKGSYTLSGFQRYSDKSGYFFSKENKIIKTNKQKIFSQNNYYKKKNKKKRIK